MENKTPKRILIVGGGVCLTVAMELERKLARDPSIEITLVNRENFFSRQCFTKSLPAISISRQL
jgi:NADH dehydrogenase FAD-containing subunit